MPLLWADSVALSYSNLAVAKKWWIEPFDCKETKVPPDWDCSLPSDVALRLPGHDLPTILLSDWTEVRNAGYKRSNDRPIIFCNKLTKAQEYFRRRGGATGPIQDGGGTEFFEVRDPEGNVIEICREP
jgi:hypothetical protein